VGVHFLGLCLKRINLQNRFKSNAAAADAKKLNEQFLFLEVNNLSRCLVQILLENCFFISWVNEILKKGLFSNNSNISNDVNINTIMCHWGAGSNPLGVK
jgi:hypothetical protein